MRRLQLGIWAFTPLVAVTRQSSASCPEHELDALELVEAEQPQLPGNLYLLQVQTSILQLPLDADATSHSSAHANVTSLTARGKSVHRRGEPQPLGLYTQTVGAPDIYWGVASLCFAAFATCGALVLGSWFLCRSHHKENYHPSLGFKVALCLFLATVIAGAFWLAAWYFAGAVLKKWLMAYDTSFLGVEVYVDRIALNPFMGTVLVQNMTLGNPEGYTSEYLAKVNELYVNVNMGESVRSLGHRLTLDQAHVRGVDVVFERALTTSNVEDVLDRLGVLQHFSPPPAGKGPQGFHVDLHVHEVQSSDVWVRAKLNLQGMYGVLTQVPNITWHDFETQVRPNSTDECIVIVSATILENVQRLMRR